MTNTSRYYKPSGATPLLGLVLMFFTGIIASIILAFIYGYLTFYIPMIYLNFILTIILGGVVGHLIGYVGKYGKIQNTKVAILFAVLFSCVSIYIAWISWINALSQRNILTADPIVLWNAIQFVAEKGAWSFKDITPKGVGLYIIWGIEAIIILTTAIIGVMININSDPFCESCNSWVSAKETVSRLEPISNPDTLKNNLEQGNFSHLYNLKKLESTDDLSSQLNLLYCASCKKNHYLTVVSISMTLDKDKTTKKNEKNIVENLKLSLEQFDMLKTHWKKAPKVSEEKADTDKSNNENADTEKLESDKPT